MVASVSGSSERSSITSLDKSKVEIILKGTFSGGADESPTCSFGRSSMNSLSSSLALSGGDDNSLICDWQHNQAILSIQEELLKEDEDEPSIVLNEGGLNESLICGWDPQLSTIFANINTSGRVN